MGEQDSTELYRRYVSAVNGNVVRNTEVVAGSTISDFSNSTALAGSVISGPVGMMAIAARFRQSGLRIYDLLEL